MPTLLIAPVWNRNGVGYCCPIADYVLLIAPVWNRNVQAEGYQDIYQQYLLIAPVWNRNLDKTQRRRTDLYFF